MKKVGGTIWKRIKHGTLYDLEEDIQSLEYKWNDLEAMKKNVEEKTKADKAGEVRISGPVRLWLDSIDLTEEEIEEIRLRAKKIQNKFLGPMYRASSSELRNKVVEMLHVVQDLNTEGQRFGKQVPLAPPQSPIVFEHSLSRFTYEALELASEGFSKLSVLGEGGFGIVHKGILPNKQTVAIKQLKPGSKQGMQEFQTEVNVISRVHHRHLVSLVGYCIAEAQMTLMLVYEFVPNKTLEFHLHGKGTKTLDWSTRMKIAIGSAKGLAYLHEDCQPKIIHRDIKAANILLDDKFKPKIADFGLAKLSSDTDTHVSTAKVRGTFGYLAPEYVSSGRLSEKSDVFSFGVVLLELIAGRIPVLPTGSFPDNSLVEWSRPLLTKALKNQNFKALADRRLQNNYNSEEMFRMASCAANCVRHSPVHRPGMSQVVDALTGKIDLDNSNKESTQVDNPDLNKFWKQTQGEYNEPTTSSLENTIESSYYSALG